MSPRVLQLISLARRNRARVWFSAVLFAIVVIQRVFAPLDLNLHLIRRPAATFCTLKEQIIHGRMATGSLALG